MLPVQVPNVIEPIQLTVQQLKTVSAALGDNGQILTQLPPELIDTNGEELGRSEQALRRALDQVEDKPHIAMLCCDLGNPAAFVRVAEYWLPALMSSGVKQPHWPFLPVLLCGTKRENFSEGASTANSGLCMLAHNICSLPVNIPRAFLS